MSGCKHFKVVMITETFCCAIRASQHLKRKMKLGLCLQLFKMRAKKFIISDGRSVWFGLVPLIFLNPD